MITNEYFEFLIFSELEPVKKAIQDLKEELSLSGDNIVVDNPIDGFNGSFIANIKIESLYKSLAEKYLIKRIEHKNFRNCFNELLLKNKFSEKHFGPIKIDVQVNSVTKLPEIKVVVNHLTTRNDWISAWQHIEDAILKWQNTKSDVDIKNRQKDFITRLKIYKAYLRAKKHWGDKFTYNEFLQSEEIISLIPSLTSGDISDRNLPYILRRFETEFSDQIIISDEELNIPLK